MFFKLFNYSTTASSLLPSDCAAEERSGGKKKTFDCAVEEREHGATGAACRDGAAVPRRHDGQQHAAGGGGRAAAAAAQHVGREDEPLFLPPAHRLPGAPRQARQSRARRTFSVVFIFGHLRKTLFRFFILSDFFQTRLAERGESRARAPVPSPPTRREKTFGHSRLPFGLFSSPNARDLRLKSELANPPAKRGIFPGERGNWNWRNPRRKYAHHDPR
eukprot:1189648-Prorocentrum_minimum.AAC.1